MLTGNRAKFSTIFSLLILLAIACSTGSGGGGDEQPTANLAGTQGALESTQAALEQASTDAAQPTAEALATELPTVEPAAEAPAFYVEEFEGDMSLWTYFFTQGEESGFSITYENGKVVFDVEDPDTYPYLTYDAYFYEDVRLDAQGRNLGSNNNFVALVCREGDRGFYEFNVANNGFYFIYLYTYDDGYQLLYQGGSTAIKTGKEVNEFTAICEGNELTLGINGVEVRTVTDGTLQEGRVGVGVGSMEFGGVLYEFEWVSISQP